jgi:hypothetical protein
LGHDFDPVDKGLKKLLEKVIWPGTIVHVRRRHFFGLFILLYDLKSCIANTSMCRLVNSALEEELKTIHAFRKGNRPSEHHKDSLKNSVSDLNSDWIRGGGIDSFKGAVQCTKLWIFDGSGPKS